MIVEMPRTWKHSIIELKQMFECLLGAHWC